MIPIEAVLGSLPRYRAFPTVEELRRRAEGLAKDPRFSVRLIGKSELGRPIHHVKFGSGGIKALFSGYPHPNEPIGGLTVLSLLSLLEQGRKELLDQPVEWHFIPCPDPDGVKLNEGWQKRPFSFQNYLAHYFRQPHNRQIEWSFPVRYKKLNFNRPTNGTRALMRVLGDVRPDFYFALHNSMFGGAYYFISKDPGSANRAKLYALLRSLAIPIHLGEPELDHIKEYSTAMYHEVTLKGIYDRIAKSYPNPQDHFPGGACSFDYLRGVNSKAQALVFETAFMKHPQSASTTPSRDNRRHLQLKAAASEKFLASLALAHWDGTKADLNRKSPLYPAVRDLIDNERKILLQLDEHLLTSPEYNRPATGSERLDLYLRWYLQLCSLNQFVRLLKDSRGTSRVKRAVKELKGEISSQYKNIDEAVDLGAFRNFDINSLLKAQLGSGLIVLNALLAQRIKN